MPSRRKKSLLQNKIQDERTGRPHREHRAKKGRKHNIHTSGIAKYKITKQMSTDGFDKKEIRKETRDLLFIMVQGKELKGEKYYSLLCHSGEKYWDVVICGIYSSREEAKEADVEVKDCPARHTIKKCNVTIEF